MSKVSFNDAMKDIISSGLRFKVAKDDKGVVSIIIKIGCFYSSITFDSDGCLDQSGFSQDCGAVSMCEVFDINGVEIESGDRVHFRNADSIDRLAIKGPLADCIDYSTFRVVFNESINSLEVDENDWLNSVGHAKFFNQLNRMLNDGRAEIASRGVKS